MFHEQSVRLKAHTLFVERVLYFPISHSNEHRLHINRFICAVEVQSYIHMSGVLATQQVHTK